MTSHAGEIVERRPLCICGHPWSLHRYDGTNSLGEVAHGPCRRCPHCELFVPRQVEHIGRHSEVDAEADRG